MASRSRDVIAAALVQKGFWQHDTHHHRYIYVTEAGDRTHIATKVSHTKKMKQIDAGLFSEMARQCRLTTSQFVDLVDCPMSRKDYEAALRGTGEID